jgi:hypothetical protein
VVISGAVKVELYAATDGPDTDFMAKLVDVYPDGYEALVLDAPIAPRIPQLPPAGGDQDDDPRRAGEAGHRPVADRDHLREGPPHRPAHHLVQRAAVRREPEHRRGPGGKARPRVATNAIYMDASHPSALVLPVVYPADVRVTVALAARAAPG